MGSITSLFEDIVAQYPHHTALRFQGQSLSYEELNRKANRLARHLQLLGVQPQDCVGLDLERGMELIIAILAILKAGAAYLPIDASYPNERKQFMINDAKPKTILSSTDFKKPFPLNDTNLAVHTRRTDVAYINYTSGSSGKPKGVEVCHRGVIRLVKNASWLPVVPEDRFLQFANISFDASTFEIWGALLNGARLCIYPQKELSMKVLERFVSEEKITHFDCTPRIFNLIADSQIEVFKSVQLINVGGDVMSPRHAALVHVKYPTCRIINGYGPTENTCLTTVYEVSDLKAIEKGVPIGKPIDKTSVYILDEHLQPVPEGVPGELYTGGEGLAKGYLNCPELTREKFIPNPFGAGRLYRTGDLVKTLPDGNIAFLGRIDNQVKLRGFRIEPSEIENTLRLHTSANDCVVALKEDPAGEKVLVAYALPKKGKTLTPESLEDFAKLKLPSYMLPSFFCILNDFPLCANGKVKRSDLPSPKELLEMRLFEPPQTPTEKKLAEIWAELFSLSKVGRTDDFFHIGGDSIDAVEMALLASAAFEISVPVNWLFEHSSLEKYAKRLDNIEVAKEEPFISWRDKEARLDPSIQPMKQPTLSQYENPKKIFLTGATGFVGAFFLRELLETTQAQVYCLVRKTRLQKVLEKYWIWKPEYKARVIEVVGDLEKPRLGMTLELFDQLSSEIDSVFHIGAYVNHALPYHKLKAANVLGTEEAIRLAARNRTKPFHHISTVDILESQNTEKTDIDLCKNLPTGYAQSKWVAEKLVLEARRRGLPANIYRLSRVCGDSETGSGSTNDFLWRTVQACLKLRKAPQMTFVEELTPVDYICKAIRYIASKENLINSHYHVLNTELYSYGELFNYLHRLGYTSPIVNFDSWKEALSGEAIRTKEAGMRALMTMFPENDSSSASFKNCDFAKAIKNAPFSCPKICETLFKKYVDYYVSIGFIGAANNW